MTYTNIFYFINLNIYLFEKFIKFLIMRNFKIIYTKNYNYFDNIHDV